MAGRRLKEGVQYIDGGLAHDLLAGSGGAPAGQKERETHDEARAVSRRSDGRAEVAVGARDANGPSSCEECEMKFWWVF